MTALIETPTSPQRQADLLRDLAGVLDRHPLGRHVRLVFAHEVPFLADDEILVQQVNPEARILELHPVKKSDVSPDDHLFAPLDPADTAWAEYALAPQATKYFLVGKDHLMHPDAA
ncbi:hypothetical protein [Streptomyces sp. NPDC047315]|uniref:hypothetical protein n=1 Tax=Streptomyces sp. NPDC047315 TaxID=3155142 RepID=UPI00340FD878